MYDTNVVLHPMQCKESHEIGPLFYNQTGALPLSLFQLRKVFLAKKVENTSPDQIYNQLIVKKANIEQPKDHVLLAGICT